MWPDMLGYAALLLGALSVYCAVKSASDRWDGARGGGSIPPERTEQELIAEWEDSEAAEARMREREEDDQRYALIGVDPAPRGDVTVVVSGTIESAHTVHRVHGGSETERLRQMLRDGSPRVFLYSPDEDLHGILRPPPPTPTRPARKPTPPEPPVLRTYRRIARVSIPEQDTPPED